MRCGSEAEHLVRCFTRQIPSTGHGGWIKERGVQVDPTAVNPHSPFARQPASEVLPVGISVRHDAASACQMGAGGITCAAGRGSAGRTNTRSPNQPTSR